MRGKAFIFAIIIGAVVGAIVIALGAGTLVDNSTGPPPPKPYDVAVYDVYSAIVPNTQEFGVKRLVDPLPENVLIRAETLTFQDSGWFGVDTPSPEGRLVPDKRFKQAVDSAVADYLKRNTSSLELQRKFNLPHYDLFNKAEEQSMSKSPATFLAVQQKHPGYERWIELSAVGFNQDQTVAVVYFVETRVSTAGGVFANGGYRMLQKRDGRWYLLPNRVFSDVAE